MTNDPANTQSLEPGIYKTLSFRDYLRLPYPSNSMIKNWQKSPKHGKAYIDGKIKFDSPAMRMGRAEHSIICEEADEEILVSTPCNGIKKDESPCLNNGKYFDGDKWWCGTHKTSNATEPNDYVSQSEFDEILEKREALRKHPCVSSIRRASWAEVTIIFDLDGVRFKGRMDKADLESEHPCVLDLKRLGSRPLSVDDCNYEIAKRGYHIQAALYRMGIWELKQIDVPFLWIFVETEYPYDILPMELRPEDAVKGQAKVEQFISEYKACQESGEWPGVWEKNRPALTSLPDWA